MSSEGLARTTRTDVARRRDPDAEIDDDPVVLSGKRVAVVAALVTATFVLLAAIFYYAEQDPNNFRSITGAAFVSSLFVPTALAFFGVFWLRGLIRDALAVGVFVGYFALVFHYVTGGYGLQGGGTAETLLTSFTGLVGTITVFYFGSVAAVEVAKQIFPQGRSGVVVLRDTKQTGDEEEDDALP